MPLKRKSTHATGASSSSDPTVVRPSLRKSAIPRYNAILACKTHWPEVRLDFPALARFNMREVLDNLGLTGLVHVWQVRFCPEIVHSFIAHLTKDPDTDMFHTRVQGVSIDFTAADVCQEVHLPYDAEEGINVYDPYSEKGLSTDEALELLFGADYQGLRSRTLRRSQLPLDLQPLSYILHHNLMPRGGRATNEVPFNHLHFLAAVRHGAPINYRPIIHIGFERLAATKVTFTAYHRLITHMCLNRRVSIEPWELHAGEIMNADKLAAMRLPPPVADGAVHVGGDMHMEEEDEPVGEAAAEEEESDHETLAQHVHATSRSSEGRILAHVDARFDALEQRVNARFDTLHGDVAAYRADIAASEGRLITEFRRLMGLPPSDDPAPAPF